MSRSKPVARKGEGWGSCDHGQSELAKAMLPTKIDALALLVTVPQSDTGRQVEQTKALE